MGVLPCERWDRGAEPIETFTVPTTGAPPTLSDLNHHQSVIIDDAALDEWLDPGASPTGLLEVAKATRGGPFDRWRAIPLLNGARHYGPKLIRPVDA